MFLPSGIGLVLYASLAMLIMVLYQFGSIQQYLGLPRDIAFAQYVKNWLDETLYNTIRSGPTEAVVVGLFWAGVGLAVYVFLQGVSKSAFELEESINERHYVWPRGSDRNSPLLQVLERSVFQTVAGVLALFWFLQPLARVLDGPVFMASIGPNVLLQYVIWFLAIVLALHVLVVLLRMVALRRRLFAQ